MAMMTMVTQARLSPLPSRLAPKKKEDGGKGKRAAVAKATKATITHATRIGQHKSAPPLWQALTTMAWATRQVMMAHQIGMDLMMTRHPSMCSDDHLSSAIKRATCKLGNM